MATTVHFKNLWRANRWRKRHPKRIVTSVDVTSKAAPPAPTKRQLVVQFAHWGILHAESIHYAQIRPFPHSTTHVLPHLPLTTDCSGWVTMAYRYAGADPNGLADGYGNTGTLLHHMKHIPIDRVRAGDVVIYGTRSYPSGHHGAIVTAVHSHSLDGIETCSLGSEAGPLAITVAQEAHYQPDGFSGIVFLTQLP